MINKTGKIAVVSISALLLGSLAYFFTGTGGSLNIDGSKTAYKPGDTIKISGKYSGGTIKNLVGTDTNPIYILGAAEFTGSIYISDNRNIVFAGTKERGLYFHDISYRPIQIGGNPTGLVLKNIYVKNCGDYSMTFDFKSAYPTVAKNLKLLNIEFENSSCISFSGGMPGMNGIIQGLEIAGCYFHDIPNAGNIVYCNAVDGYDVHDNTINNVNTTNNDHNGLFHLIGCGKFYNNKATNHQGNLLRAWLWTLGTTPKTTEIYNCIAFNSRKYSGFEVQSFANYIIPSKTTYSNAIVKNNTCGDINTSHDWTGGVVDVYNLFGGKCEVYNNLAFNTYNPNTIANQQSSTTPIVTNNIYKTTWKGAVVDLTSFKSLFPGIGASADTLIVKPTPIPDTIVILPPPVPIEKTFSINEIKKLKELVNRTLDSALNSK